MLYRGVGRVDFPDLRAYKKNKESKMSDTILTEATYLWIKDPSFSIKTEQSEGINRWYWTVYRDDRRIHQGWYFHTEGGARDDALLYLEANYGK